MTRFDYRNVKLDVGGRIVRGEKVASVDALPGVYYTMDRPIPQLIIEARIIEARGTFLREMGMWWPKLNSPLRPVNVVDKTPRSAPMNINLGVGTTLGGGRTGERGRTDSYEDQPRSDSGGGIGLGGIGVGTGTSVPVGGNDPKGVTAAQVTFDLPDVNINLDQAYIYLLLETGRELDGRIIARPLLLPIRTVSDPKAPEIKQREAATTVRIRDDNTIMLGGLTASNEA